jgi:hypothetical protein
MTLHDFLTPIIAYSLLTDAYKAGSHYLDNVFDVLRIQYPCVNILQTFF